jgi:hypothetical protein
LLAKAYLRAGFGDLVLCAKIDEADLWRKYLRETGRETGGIFFGEDSSHSFNFLSYESAVSGADLEENIVNLTIEVARITNPQGRGERGILAIAAEKTSAQYPLVQQVNRALSPYTLPWLEKTFGHLNPTLGLLFNLAGLATVLFVLSMTLIPILDRLFIRDLIRRGEREGRKIESFHDEIQQKAGKKNNAR